MDLEHVWLQKMVEIFSPEEEQSAEHVFLRNDIHLLRLLSLKKRSDFLSLRGKEVFFSKFFILQMDPTPLDDSIHYGIVASKKIGNAVKRNRAKRKMRSLFLEITRLNKNIQSVRVVMIAKHRLIEGDYGQILEDLKRGFEKGLSNASD